MASVLRQAARRFATSAVSRKDLVQDLYLRELKAYKPTPVAKDAHVGVVKTLSTPSAPKAPAFTTDLAAELAAYDSASPVPEVAPTATSTTATDSPNGAEAFLSFLEQDLPKKEAHHH